MCVVRWFGSPQAGEVAAHERVRWGMDSSFPLGGDPYREVARGMISKISLIFIDLLSITSRLSQPPIDKSTSNSQGWKI